MGELDLSGLQAAASNAVPSPGWFRDPYDSGYQGPVLYSLSDDLRLDALFPDHPLSRIRASLAQIQGSVKFDASVRVTSDPRFRIDGAANSPSIASTISAEAVGML